MTAQETKRAKLLALANQRAELEAQYEALQAELRDEAIEGIRAEITELGLQDVFQEVKPVKSSGIPMYRNPNGNQTWVGRGKPPEWIRGLSKEQREKLRCTPDGKLITPA